MGTSLTGKQIKNTYKSLIKTSDSTEASATAKLLSDGNGNDFGVYIDTDGVFGIGSAPSYSLDVSSRTDGVALPVGTTANRPTPTNGLLRYNSTIGKIEFYDGGWKTVFTTSGGTIDGSLIVTGDLTIQGTTVTLNTETVQFEDNILLLNRASADTQYDATNAGIEIEKTSATNPSFLYTYSTSTWGLTDNLTVEGDLTVDTNTLYVDSADNRVGIGTASPNAELEIHGNLNIGDGTSVTSIGLQRNSANYITATDAAGYLVFRTGGANERMRIHSGGDISFRDTSNNEAFYWDASAARLGIGAGTSPSAALDVEGSAHIGPSGYQSYFTNSVGNNSAIITSSTGNMELRGTSTDYYHLFLKQGGNVGIGTNPSAKLDISFTGGGDSIKSASTSSTSYNSSKFYNDNSKGWHNLVYGSAYSGGSLLNVGADGAIIYGNTTSGITTLGAFNLLFGTNNTPRMTIDSSGNVGIGVTPSSWRATETVIQLPDAAFYSGNNYVAIGQNYYIPTTGGSVYEESNYASDYYQSGGTHVWRTAASGTAGNAITWNESMRIDSSGRVGIGLTPYTTSSLLNLKGNGLAIKNDLNGGSNNWSLIQNLASTTESSIDFTSGQGLAMTIAHNKNVGIGTDNPSAGIHVKHGSITTSSDYSSFLSNATAKIVSNHSSEYGISIGYANASTDAIGIQSGSTGASRPLSLQPFGGNVGIGTDNPARTLEVNSGTASDIVSFGNDSGSMTFGQTTSLTSLDLATSNAYRIRQGASTPFYINTVGDVGIGTTSPDETLHLHKAGTNYLKITNNTTGQGSADGLIIGNLDSDGTALIWNYENAPVMFGTNNTERLRITSDGNVLIGPTTNTPQKLEVFGIDSTAYSSTDDNAQKAYGASICVSNNDGTTNSFAQIVFDTAGTNQSIARIVAIRTGTSSNDMAFVVEGGNTKREAMRILSSGGITFNGDTAAANALDDYEEGTFAATFNGSTNTATGYYTKIGNMVHFQVYSGDINVASPSVAAIVGGLPFTAKTNAYSAISVTHNTYTAGTAENGYVIQNGTTISLMVPNSVSGRSTSVGYPKYIMLAGTYQTS
jgi:hypothetical protein